MNENLKITLGISITLLFTIFVLPLIFTTFFWIIAWIFPLAEGVVLNYIKFLPWP